MPKIIALTGIVSENDKDIILQNLKSEYPTINIGIVPHQNINQVSDDLYKSNDSYHLRLFANEMNQELEFITNEIYDIILIPNSIINILAFSSMYNRRELIFSQLRFIKYYIKNYTKIYFIPANDEKSTDFEKNLHEHVLELYSPLGITLKQLPYDLSK